MTSTINEIADTFELYFVYYRQAPQSNAPYFHTDWGLANVIAQGFDFTKLYLGLGNFGAYWPVAGEEARHVMTHAQALEMIDTYDSTLEWVESDGRGLVREWYAAIDGGYLHLLDGTTLGTSLSLADKYKLPGMMLFSLRSGFRVASPMLPASLI